MFQTYSLQIAIAVFFITVIASRFMLMNALKKLSDEDKAKLLSSGMISGSQTRLLVVFGVLAVYYFSIVKFPQYAKELLFGFVFVVVASRIFTFISSKRKLQNLQLPDDYIRAFINSSMLYNIGLIVFFFLLMKDYL